MGVIKIVGRSMVKLCSASHIAATLDPELFTFQPPQTFDGLDVIVVRLTDEAAVELIRSIRGRGDVIRRACSGQRWMGAVEDVCLISPSQKRRSELMAVAKSSCGNLFLI
jgi:hypothetical protein